MPRNSRTKGIRLRRVRAPYPVIVLAKRIKTVGDVLTPLTHGHREAQR